jgi:hypothetical protein
MSLGRLRDALMVFGEGCKLVAQPCEFAGLFVVHGARNALVSDFEGLDRTPEYNPPNLQMGN